MIYIALQVDFSKFTLRNMLKEMNSVKQRRISIIPQNMLLRIYKWEVCLGTDGYFFFQKCL